MPHRIWTLAIAIALLWAGLLPAQASVVINEFQASNGSTLADEDGDFPDWIELFNGGSDPVALGGWTLSDDPADPGRWTFPPRTIGPGGFLLVFASGKDRAPAIGPLHADFAISSEGEPLILSNAQGEVVDHLPPAPVPRDVSYGRSPDGSGTLAYFVSPTPGAPNGEGLPRLLPAIEASHASGWHADPFGFTAAIDAVGAVIRYTLDGSVPTDSSPVLDGPLWIADRSPDPNGISMIPTNNGFPGNPLAEAIMGWRPPEGLVAKATVVRMAAFADDAVPSPVATRSFWVGEDFEGRYAPAVISIATDPDGLFSHEAGIYVPGANYDPNAPDPTQTGNPFERGDEWERAAHIEFLEPGFAPGFAMDAGIRIHGGATRRFPLKSLRVYFRSGYGEDTLHYPLFPTDPDATGFRRLILRNQGNDSGFEPYLFRDDATLMRDPLLQRLAEPLGLDVQNSRPAIVFINGEYWGTHHIRQRFDRHFLAARHGVDPDNIDLLTRNAEVVEGDAEEFIQMSRDARDWPVEDPAVFQHFADRIDLENLADYFAIQVYSGNRDWPPNNMDFWRVADPPGKWRWMLYDAEWMAFGHLGPSTASRNDLSPAIDAVNRTSLMFKGLLRNRGFRDLFLNRAADQLNTILLPARVQAAIDGMAAELRPGMEEHIRRWGRPGSAAQWELNLGTLRAFALQRPAWLRQHYIQRFGLAGAYQLSIDLSAAHGMGGIRLNSIDLSREAADADAWAGIYFSGVPIELEALALDGYRFARWEGSAPSTDPLIRPVFFSSATARPVFEVDPDWTYAGDGPAPHPLALGPWSFEAWPADSPAGTFPRNMEFQQTAERDPGLDVEFDGLYGFPYDLDSRSRVIGLGGRGLAMINTANPQEGGGGYLGRAVLALDTRGASNPAVWFVAGTEVANPRPYALRLRYRVGDSGPFVDLPGPDGGPVEYASAAESGHEAAFGPIPLPADALGRAYLQIAWQYHSTGDGSESGPRSMIRLDDIVVRDRIGGGWVLR